jgi:hypothetical protein
MTKRWRLVVVALCASALVLVAVGTASANRLSFTNTGIRIVWPEMAFVGEGASGGFTVRCPVTLEGTLHSGTITKVTNLLIGHITRAAIGECEGGRVRLLMETLPWHIRYESFSGTLPRITGISLTNVGMSWLVEPVPGISCLYRATSEQPARGEMALGLEGEINGYRWSAGARIPLVGGLLCPSVSWMTGNGTVTLLGTSQKVRARLI